MEGKEATLPFSESACVPAPGWVSSVQALPLGQALSLSQVGSWELGEEKGHAESRALVQSCSE